LAWAPPTGTTSGRFFLSAEPYKTGITPAAVQAPAGGGNSRLLLGYPAEDVWAALTFTPGRPAPGGDPDDPDHPDHPRFAYLEMGKSGS